MKLENLLSIFNPQLPYLENANNDRAVRLRKILINGTYICENQHKCNTGSDKKEKNQVMIQGNKKYESKDLIIALKYRTSG